MKRMLESSLIVNRRAAVLAGAAGLASVGLSSSRVAAQATPEAPALLQQWAAGWSNLADPSTLLALVTDDVVYEDVAAGDLVEGATAFKQLLGDAYTAIPDFTITLDTGFVSGDLAAAECVISGNQSGDLPYLAATGKSFSLRAASIFTLAGGKIQRESRYYSMLSFLTQLGALSGDKLPPLGTPQPAPPQ
jgi:steroid delta-isomerase-like uncharacterized protein